MLNIGRINEINKKLEAIDPTLFNGAGNSFTTYLNKIKINDFRHIQKLEVNFDHPVTVITGTNRIGKTSILLLIACSHENFMKYDSTNPDTELRPHHWRDVINFTSYESSNRTYSYELFWRVGTEKRTGTGKREATKSWTGLAKSSKDRGRINAKIRNRELRLIDLERLLPARNFSSSLLRKIFTSSQIRLHEDIEHAFRYILEIEPVEIYKIGSHINKIAYLIKPVRTGGSESYSSYNAASGEESLINILVDIFTPPDNSLILIDEIEAGIHPNVQRRLAEIIKYLSWTNKKQFIITTHSPSFLASLPQKSRKFIDKNANGEYNVISNISVNAAFSKMDAHAYPLVTLYCEDDIAKYIIKNILVKVNRTVKYFDRLVNIIISGPVNEVRGDYERHKRNYNQLRLKVGFCCVIDGDKISEVPYSDYVSNNNDHVFFIYPYDAPEKFLVQSYLKKYPNQVLETALTDSDHHLLFEKMVNTGLATDAADALHKCWQTFELTPEYAALYNKLKTFLIKTVQHFSKQSD